MSKEKTVFWSWQSDLDGRVTKDVIRFALDEAIRALSGELEEAERPSLTSDTQGVAGSPDIVATILKKIEEAQVFVADVTPIAISDNGKACANPNVLIELGFAQKALGDTRIIKVWNSAFKGAHLSSLPFDLRGRRGPISYFLAADATTGELRSARSQLAEQLKSAIKLALAESSPPESKEVPWQRNFEGDDDLWFDRTQPQFVNHPSFGTSEFRWMDGHIGYARLMPSNWSAAANAKTTLIDPSGHPALLGRVSSLHYGNSRGGAMVYAPRQVAGEDYEGSSTLTQWFEKTGEFWGVGAGFLFERDGRLTLATGYFPKLWLNFLKRNCELALQHGGSLPMRIRLGIKNLTNSWWPRGQFDFIDEGYRALEDSFEYEAVLELASHDEIRVTIEAAFNKLEEIYGRCPSPPDQVWS